MSQHLPIIKRNDIGSLYTCLRFAVVKNKTITILCLMFGDAHSVLECCTGPCKLPVNTQNSLFCVNTSVISGATTVNQLNKGTWFANSQKWPICKITSVMSGEITGVQQKTGKNKLGYSCETCGKHYMCRGNMQRHMRHECGKEPTLSCPSCPYLSKYKHHLLRHINLRHKDENIFPYSLFQRSLSENV